MIAGGSMPLNTKRQFIISANEREVEFWIDAVLYARIATPSGQGVPWMSATLPFSVRHAIAAARPGGVPASRDQLHGEPGQPRRGHEPRRPRQHRLRRAPGSRRHDGLLATYANSTTPAGVAGSNTAAAATARRAGDAQRGSGGGYRLHLDLVSGAGRNHGDSGPAPVLNGVRISAANLGAAVATTETTLAFSLAFGQRRCRSRRPRRRRQGPRRVALGIMSWAIGAAIGAGPREGSIFMPFASPIVVNPGEFIASVAKFLQGTATASQTVYIQVALDYGWV